MCGVGPHTQLRSVDSNIPPTQFRLDKIKEITMTYHKDIRRTCRNIDDVLNSRYVQYL